MKMKCLLAVGVLSVVLAGCNRSSTEMDHSQMDHSSMQSNKTKDSEIPVRSTVIPTILSGREINLTAMASNQEIAPGVTTPVWTFNNMVPGPQIRVKQGDTVKVNLKNELPVPVSIHWHGYPVPNNMDGIPGVTQNAVKPGETYTYEFKATVPGTYWYHSHQDSVNQVDRGLYGTLVVEGPNDDKVDRDYTLVLDEWVSNGTGMSGMDMSSDMSGMDHSQMNMDSSASNHSNAPMEHDMNMYDVFTINGKSGSLIEPLTVKEGDKVRLRLINAGYLPHRIHLHGHEFKVVATDGQPINNPGILKDSIVSIGPGERYDLEFTANNPGQWLIEDHSASPFASGMRAVIAYEGSSASADISNAMEELPVVDLAIYGQTGQNTFNLNQKFDHEYTMELNTTTKNDATLYTINGKSSPETDPLHVKKGDTVKVRLKNKSPDVDHPMHLHGHFFQVLSKNGKSFTGSPVMKDTLNIKPGEEYIVAFKADNPGNWMFHCHELHHASAGMVTELKYSDYQSNFTADPSAGNKPE
nr:multicopper oxidase family protein [Gorillibacterium massiliense]